MSSDDRFLVAYDIADPRRLRRVARHMEKVALRVQKSVFIFRGTRQHLVRILDQLLELIDPNFDIVQAWRLPRGDSGSGMQRGSTPTLFAEVALLEGDQVRFVGQQQNGSSDEPGHGTAD